MFQKPWRLRNSGVVGPHIITKMSYDGLWPLVKEYITRCPLLVLSEFRPRVTLYSRLGDYLQLLLTLST